MLGALEIQALGFGGKLNGLPKVLLRIDPA
jgi:hypothetical protein